MATEIAATPLRICCYGSSSSRTPEKYTAAAYDLGRLLARRGHTCVNGAGAAGCMAAMNRGASESHGRIVGVIHEKFLVDGSDWLEGAHSVFREGQHEILIARGNDLRERKRLLVKGADALVVLPGGAGTWDELWEMACARHIGFHAMPIVCVSVDGFYEDFKAILKRAHEDELLYKHPRDILHFEETPEAAVKWIEAYLNDPNNNTTQQTVITRQESALTVLGRKASVSGIEAVQDHSSTKVFDSVRVWHNLVIFSAGLSLGVLVASRLSSSR